MSESLLFKPVENNSELEQVIDNTLLKNGAILHQGNKNTMIHNKLYEIQGRGAIFVCLALNGNSFKTTLLAGDKKKVYEGPGILSLVGFNEKSDYYVNLKQAIEADLRPNYLF